MAQQDNTLRSLELEAHVLCFHGESLLNRVDDQNTLVAVRVVIVSFERAGFECHSALVAREALNVVVVRNWST